jgi:hypothetical protein
MMALRSLLRLVLSSRSEAKGSAFLPIGCQILPSRILCLDQRDLPHSVPILKFLLASNRALYVLILLEVDEAIDPVTRSEGSE